MQTLNWPNRAAYEKRLFGSHDFKVHVDVLNLDEQVIGTARFIDGQVNYQDETQPCRRTADLTLSDPAGALDFSTSSAWSGTSVWVDRLIRVRHVITISGTDVTATPFIGPPATLSRAGAEVSVSCQDKTALALHGAPPLTVRKGMNAVTAIKTILAQCTGEFRFRFPTTTRRLSRDYSVGWDDQAAPWLVAVRIARVELGMQLLYAGDGAALLRVKPINPSLTVPGVTEQAVGSVDFTTLHNYVRVSGKETTKKSGTTTIKTQPFASAQLRSASNLSPTGLARKGVPRYLPLVIADDSYTKTSQVKDRADAELAKSDRLESSTEFSCVPFFHADSDDLVNVRVDGVNNTVRLVTGSIPLGVGGDMTIGTHRLVSKRPMIRSRVWNLKWRKKVTGTKKHHKTKWVRI